MVIIMVISAQTAVTAEDVVAQQGHLDSSWLWYVWDIKVNEEVIYTKWIGCGWLLVSSANFFASIIYVTREK